MQTSLDQYSVRKAGDSCVTSNAVNDLRPLLPKPAQGSANTQASAFEETRGGSSFSPATTTLSLQRKLGTLGGSVASYYMANDFYRSLAARSGAAEKEPEFGTSWLGQDQRIRPEEPSGSAFPKCVLSFALDSRNEFVVVQQRSALTLISTDSALGMAPGEGADAAGPILSLSAHLVEQQTRGSSGGLSFGFTAAEFMGSTLNLLCGVSRGGSAKVFDLEAVDEDTCAPLRTFDLRETQRFSWSLRNPDSGSTDVAAFMNDVAPLSDQTTVAALSNGESVWLDMRQPRPVLCTPAGHGLLHGGTLNIAGRSLSAGVSPLTAVTFSVNGHQLVTGAKNGSLKLWDSRKTHSPIAAFQNRSEICCLRSHFSNAHPGSTSVWGNDFAGDVFGFLCAADGFCEIGRTSLQDASRTDETAFLPPQKLTILGGADMLFYPHLSSNSLIGLTLRRRQWHTSQERVSFDTDSSELDSSSGDDTPACGNTKRSSLQGFQLASTLYAARQSPSTKYQRGVSVSANAKLGLTPSVVLHVGEDQETLLSCCCSCEVHGAIFLGGSNGKTALVLPTVLS